MIKASFNEAGSPLLLSVGKFTRKLALQMCYTEKKYLLDFLEISKTIQLLQARLILKDKSFACPFFPKKA
jgi:hypothetical protein